jgi:hypothetical protein
VLNNGVGEGRVFGRVDFGQREDQKRNCDRENAVTEENDPFDTRLSFICHLLDSLRQINFLLGNGKVSK